MDLQKRISDFNEISFKIVFHKAGLEPQEYVYHWFLCMLGNPHPLRAGHRETERESLLWGRSVFECRPHWLLHQTSGAQHHGVSGNQLRKNNTVSNFRNPNRVKPGGEEDEEEVCTMSRKRRWHNFKMKIARNQIKSKWRMFAKNCKQILKKCVCQEE